MRKINQTGFSGVEALLILVILAILVGTGLFVYKAQNSANKTLDTADKTAASQTQTPKRSVVTPTADQKYLTITEWNVKIPLGDADSGAYYRPQVAVEQSASDPTNLTVYATNAEDVAGPAGLKCSTEYVANLLRLPKNDPKWQPSVKAFDGNIPSIYTDRTIIGDYKYAIATKKEYLPACFAISTAGEYKADPATQQKFTSIVSEFTTDFKGITAN